MKYYVIELQNTEDNHAYIMNSSDTRLGAESIYHQILASAAISNVLSHGAMMFTSDGVHIAHQIYSHPVEPAPTPEPEEGGEGDDN